jgi:hypothetical protein
MSYFKQTSGLAIILALTTGLAPAVQAAGRPQPNAASPALMQAMSAQAAAGRAAAMVTIAPPATVHVNAAHPPVVQPNTVSPAYVQSLAAQAAAGKSAALVTIAPPAYTQSLAAQAAAGKTAALTTFGAPAHVQSIIAQAAAAKNASLVTIASPAAIAQNAPYVPKGIMSPPTVGSNPYGGMALSNALSSLDASTGLNSPSDLISQQTINQQIAISQSLTALARTQVMQDTQTQVANAISNSAANMAKVQDQSSSAFDQILSGF